MNIVDFVPIVCELQDRTDKRTDGHTDGQHYYVPLRAPSAATGDNNATGVDITSSTLIDHVYTSCPNRISLSKIVRLSLSDHFGILAVYSNKNAKLSGQGHKFIRYRDTKKFNSDAFLEDLAQVPWHLIESNNDPNEALSLWYQMFEDVLNIHAPMRKKRVKYWHQPEWLNQDILGAIHLRDQLCKQKQFAEYRKQRNVVKCKIRKARRDFYAKIISGNQGDAKKTWQCIQNLDGSKAQHFPSVVNDKNGAAVLGDINIASVFNHHFSNICKASETSESVDSTDFSRVLTNFISSRKNESDKFTIPLLTEGFVLKQLQRLQITKARGIDNLSPFFLKQSAEIITPTLTKLFNRSIETGIFPDVWKIAKVTPLHKKGPRNDVNNYRPISVLCSLSKIIERHVHDTLYSYLSKYNLIYEGQSGFRPNHSCITALTRMTDRWLAALDSGQMVGATFIDLRKAFDSVNHEILLKKLIMYGCSPAAISWFASYLSGRTQLVNFKGSLSDREEIDKGVPQGSIIGPLLFIVFVNDIHLHLKECETDLYADDTSLYTVGDTLVNIKDKLQRSMDIVCRWCECNDLKINVGKTTCMLIATRQRRSHLQESSLNISVNGQSVPMCEVQRVLGININQDFNWGQQISSLCQSINYRLYILRRIQHFLPMNTRTAFCNAYILPSIDYCSTIWGGTSVKNLEKVGRLQKRAARLIFNDYSSRSNTLFRRLNWLPVMHRIEHNKAVLVYKCMNNLLPEYMNEMFTVQSSSRYTLRSETRGNLVIPKATTNLFKQSLQYSGPKIWNDLPVTLRNSESLATFKKGSLEFQQNKMVER